VKKLTPTRVAPEGLLRFLFTNPGVRAHSPAIFLDRDGVINQRILSGYVTQWSEFRWMGGIAPALAELSALKLPLLVVSNQAGVGKGLITMDSLTVITNRFVSDFRELGARIDAVYYCPHRPEDNCSCRKPRAGLLLQAAQDWRIDLHRSVLVGDSPSDVEAARAVHCRTVLLAPPIGQEASNTAPAEADEVIHAVSGIPGSVRRLLRETA
jgi:D-glycero-D-manno-heptose 1,7-bisphosphate phosphatase